MGTEAGIKMLVLETELLYKNANYIISVCMKALDNTKTNLSDMACSINLCKQAVEKDIADFYEENKDFYAENQDIAQKITFEEVLVEALAMLAMNEKAT